MRKRIAIVGDDPSFNEAIGRAVEGKPVILSALEGDSPPPATSAVVGPAPQAELLVNAALSAGDEHSALFLLVGDAVAVREDIPLGSSKRVLGHATRLAEALGLSEDEQLALERAAVLRDIGKLRINNDLLLKKNVLDYDEWHLLQNHAVMGAELLEEWGVCADVLSAIRYHHECYDGDGYPEGLEKDQIPMLARAVKIIDVYCAMTSPRHYRPTYADQDQARQHLKNERGKHFDPEMIDAFISNHVARQLEEG